MAAKKTTTKPKPLALTRDALGAGARCPVCRRQDPHPPGQHEALRHFASATCMSPVDAFLVLGFMTRRHAGDDDDLALLGTVVEAAAHAYGKRGKRNVKTGRGEGDVLEAMATLADKFLAQRGAKDAGGPLAVGLPGELQTDAQRAQQLVTEVEALRRHEPNTRALWSLSAACGVARVSIATIADGAGGRIEKAIFMGADADTIASACLREIGWSADRVTKAFDSLRHNIALGGKRSPKAKRPRTSTP